MSETWLDWAIDDPAPAGNCGYTALNIACETTEKRGVVVHSYEGYVQGRPSDLMRARGNSWDATIGRDGRVWRHRPRPTFVSWHAGGPAQNTLLLGFEMEGLATDPWTELQKAALLRVLQETWRWHGWTEVVLGTATDRQQETIRRVILSLSKGELWEHRFLSATSCPSGRNQWAWLIPALQGAITQEEDMGMTDAEKADLAAHLGTFYKQIGHLRGLLGLPPQFGDVTPEELATYPSPVLEALKAQLTATMPRHRHRFSGETDEV